MRGAGSGLLLGLRGAVTSIEPKSQLRSSMMALSDLTVRQAKAADKTYSIPDTDGLGLVVAPTSGKSWHLRYYWLGKQKRISWATTRRSACARLVPCATRPGRCWPRASTPHRPQAETACGQTGFRLHLQGGLRRLGRASPQGTQGRSAKHALPDPPYLRQGRAAQPWEDVDLRHSPAPASGCPGKDRAAQGLHYR